MAAERRGAQRPPMGGLVIMMGGSHAGFLLDQIERPPNIVSLRVEAASKREQFGRVVDAMGDNGGLRGQGTKLLPDIGMPFGKECIQGNVQGQVLLLEDPANPRNTPIYGVLSKRLIDNIRVSRSRVRSEVRAVPKTPHFDIKYEADRDLLFPRPCSYMNGFSR